MIDLTTVEAMTCLEAITFMTNLGFRRAYIERDALTIIKKLRSVSQDKSVICNIIKEIPSQQEIFCHLSFHYVPISTNRVVHGLAVWGCRFDSPRY